MSPTSLAGIDRRGTGSYPGAVPKLPNVTFPKLPTAALQWAVAFVVGVGLGFLAWGEPGRRREAEFVQNLGAVLGDVREQNRLMQALLAEGTTKSRQSLQVCEKLQVKLQTDLEACLFAKADEIPSTNQPDDGEPRTGLVPFAETRTYPVPVPENK